jgi:hypothetical protein
LVVRTQANRHASLGRECWFTSVEWDDNEWPVVNTKRPIELQVTVPFLTAQVSLG